VTVEGDKAEATDLHEGTSTGSVGCETPPTVEHRHDQGLDASSNDWPSTTVSTVQG